MPPRTRKSAADRKAEIVQAALRLAAEHGPDRLTTQRLADAVGLTQPAIFRHFPTKPDIWRAVGEKIVGGLALDASATRTDDPPGQIARLVQRHLAAIARNPAIPAILFSRELHAENDAMRQLFQAAMANRRSVFADLVRLGQANGDFRPVLDPEAAGELILATVQGVAMRWSLENRDFDLPAKGAQLMAVLTDGFRGGG